MAHALAAHQQAPADRGSLEQQQIRLAHLRRSLEHAYASAHEEQAALRRLVQQLQWTATCKLDEARKLARRKAPPTKLLPGQATGVRQKARGLLYPH